MIGIRTILKTSSNNLQIQIPDSLKNMELEVIILPANTEANNNEYEFWSDEELKQVGTLNLGKKLTDKEDYSKW